MMKNFIKIFFAISFLVFFFGCACPVEMQKKEDGNLNKSEGDVTFEVVNISSWLNLMPGPDPASFHISGDVKINYTDEDQVMDLNLYKVEVFQRGKKLYSFRPFFTYNLKKIDTGSYSEPSKEITFGTDEKLPVKKELDDTKPVSAELHFKSKDAEYSFRIDEISLEKAY